LTSSTNKSIRTKAMLAIAFAGSMVTSQLPSVCKESPEASSSSSVIEVITKNASSTPEEKAYYLLQIAYCYIIGSDVTYLESTFASIGKQSDANRVRGAWRRERAVASWAESLSLLSQTTGGRTQSSTERKKISYENLALSDKAITLAVAQLGQDSKNSETLNLYLVASCLSRMIGNKQNEQKCIKILNDEIHACEASKTVNSAQIQVVASILSSMAYGLVPIRIPDYQGQTTEKERAIDMENVEESERLKLRATALLDRLPSTDQGRRKAHRDLTLWYLQLGKIEKSLKQKQELFELVGVKDDSILYPQPGMCGHPLWWSVAKVAVFENCGMG